MAYPSPPVPKIKVTHLKDKDIYYFKLEQGNWIVNSEELSVEWKGMELTSKTLPVIERIHSQTLIKAYVNSDGDQLTLDEYKQSLDELLEHGTEDDEGDYEFADLDREYAYKKFRRAYSPVYETIKTSTPYELTVIHAMLESGSQFIEPLFAIDTNQAQLVKLYANKFELDVVNQWATETGNKVEIPSHGHLRFAKLNGNYAFNDEFDGKYPVLTLTPEAAESHMKTAKAKIYAQLTSRVTPIKGSALNVSYIITQLDLISRECSELAYSKKARATSFSSIGTKARELIGTIREQLMESAISEKN